MRGALTLLVAVVVSFASCRSNPDQKAPMPRASEAKQGGASEPRRDPRLQTPQIESDVGKEGAQQVEMGMGIVSDPELSAYVQEIGARLARHAPGFRFDYHFAIVDDWAPNAFALPGGYIFVSRGLLALTQDEDALANVIGHEIAHVASRHASAQQELRGGGFSQFFKFRSQAAYSRDLERTADRLGQGLAAVAGYDPMGMADFLHGLDRITRAQRGSSRGTFFLDTHPGSRERAAEMAQRAGGIHWTRQPGVSADADDHLRRLDGLHVGDDPHQGLFAGSRFLHPDLAFTIRFPDGWDTANSPAAVGAMAPDRRAQILLRFAGTQEDPERAAGDWLASVGKQVSVDGTGPVRLVGREGWRLTGTGGGAKFDATFVPWRGAIFAIECASAGPKKIDAQCQSTKRSFRPMTRELLARLRVRRLHVVEAKSGETLAALGARTGNAWGLLDAAAWNALPTTKAFSGGELVKIVRETPYQPPAAEGAR